MCYTNRGYSAGMNMYNRRSYGTDMYSYNQSRNISGTYICDRVSVIDMSGMVRYRFDCRPISNTGMYQPTSTMY